MNGCLCAFQSAHASTQQAERGVNGVHLAAQRAGDVFVERVAASTKADEFKAVRHAHTVIAVAANRLRNTDARNTVAGGGW